MVQRHMFHNYNLKTSNVYENENFLHNVWYYDEYCNTLSGYVNNEKS